MTTSALEQPSGASTNLDASAKALRHVPLPALDEDLLHRTAGGGAAWGDSRRFPRFVAAAEGRLQAEGTFADAGHEPCSQAALLRDLSRGGLRFLHGEELFPSERCGIVLPNGSKMRLEVMWCRRIGVGVYMSGCRFFSTVAPARADVEGAASGEASDAGD